MDWASALWTPRIGGDDVNLRIASEIGKRHGLMLRMNEANVYFDSFGVLSGCELGQKRSSSQSYKF